MDKVVLDKPKINTWRHVTDGHDGHQTFQLLCCKKKTGDNPAYWTFCPFCGTTLGNMLPCRKSYTPAWSFKVRDKSKDRLDLEHGTFYYDWDYKYVPEPDAIRWYVYKRERCRYWDTPHDKWDDWKNVRCCHDRQGAIDALIREYREHEYANKFPPVDHEANCTCPEGYDNCDCPTDFIFPARDAEFKIVVTRGKEQLGETKVRSLIYSDEHLLNQFIAHEEGFRK